MLGASLLLPPAYTFSALACAMDQQWPQIDGIQLPAAGAWLRLLCIESFGLFGGERYYFGYFQGNTVYVFVCTVDRAYETTAELAWPQR